jgi:quinol monooxygenase YgiN
MAVQITGEIPGQTQQGYDGMLNALEQIMKQAPGFISHSAFPVDGGWRVIEVWESKAAATEFFAKHIAPNLPPGVKPKRTIQELHSLVRN